MMSHQTAAQPIRTPLAPVRAEQSQPRLYPVGSAAGTLARAPNPEIPAELGSPEQLLHNLARGIFEAIVGVRELEQMARWMSPDVFAKLLARIQHALRARKLHGTPVLTRPQLTVRRCVWQSPAVGVVESTVIVDLGTRCRAVAIRLQEHRNRWRAESVSIL